MSCCTMLRPPVPVSSTSTPAGSVPAVSRRWATVTPKPSSRQRTLPTPATSTRPLTLLLPRRYRPASQIDAGERHEARRRLGSGRWPQRDRLLVFYQPVQLEKQRYGG